MTKEMCISLIAGAALCAVGSLSIGSAFDSRVAMNVRADPAVTELAASGAGTSDWRDAVLDSTVRPRVDRNGYSDFGSEAVFDNGTRLV